MTTKDQQPKLATLVQAGGEQTETEKINDFIYMAKDISNAYLVKTKDGDVLINAGFMGSAERIKQLFAPLRSGPLQAIFLTQAHADHFGGVPALKEANTKIIAHSKFSDTANFFKTLMPHLGRRSGKLWSGTIKGRGAPVPDIEPDTTFEDRVSLTIGDVCFEAISTPGGEAPDASVIWLGNEKIVFSGNVFGPVFMSVPNLNTIRGDKPRSVNRFLESVDTVRKLGAELLITGHGEPIRGKERIAADLNKLYDGVTYIRDATIAGMNSGKSVHELMAEIRLPEALQLGEFHGKVSWAVKSIWQEFSGWFFYDSTTSLYEVPASAVHQDLCELAGGAQQLAARAAAKIDAHKPLEALHLLDIALNAEPQQVDALTTKKRALEMLLQHSGGTNLSEVMWLKSEIADVAKLLS
ncbi:MBL fold metallo-hydrolase [Zhongshania aquimaris]|uniref:MBL fold metallo-hydrolase n=1 Tax=Zhongshania aquimaris TaxID=2857107 RepID=A0ABS6VX07_9GAMM|nr:MBL fold metallo-hydrolase [Zhongshania aquimaris]MBW2942533.1 MBL fold metallo-hydrolase [Zhongshania aquimaris]